MKPRILIGAFAALLLGILAIAGAWSYAFPVQPAVGPDTTSTPNPTGERK